MLEKTERPGVFKDTKTNTIINRDINRLNEYKQKKKLFQESKVVLEEISSLKKDVDEMKKLLARLCSALEEK